MTIHWPDKFHPSRAPVHVRNEIGIPAPCERVWAWLKRAQLWPSWYDNSADVASLRIARDRFGEDEALRGLHDRSVGVQCAAGDRTDERQMKGRGDEEELFVDRAGGEVGGVVEGLEVRHAVRGTGGVKKII